MNGDDLMLFGKHRGRPLSKVPERYFHWLIQQEWLEHHPLLVLYVEERLGLEFNPPRKPRKCVLTTCGTVTGDLYDPSANDGTCPFNAETTLNPVEPFINT